MQGFQDRQQRTKLRHGCQRHSASYIRSPLSRDRDVPGVIGRFLQRTESICNTSNRLYQRGIRVAVGSKTPLLSEKNETLLDSAAPCTPIVAVPADTEQPSSTAFDANDIAQPQPQQTAPSPTTAPKCEMPSATITTPQPQLKKKTSFRDRLKAWQKPPQPLQVVAEESKPRFAYKPTHAAADFSRLAVSPLSPPRHQFPPDHRRSRQGDDGWEEGKEGSRRRRSRSGTNHHPCVALDETFQAANATAHVPVPTQPVALDANAETQRNRGAAPSQPLSDYELFIARAEAEDREWRGHILRNISHRSAAYTADRVKPDPHRQFAAAGASSAGRSPEVNSDKLPPHKDNNIQEHAMGSGNASTQSPPRWELRQSGSRGHARQPSWARSSTSTNITAAEKSPDKKKSSRSSNQALVQQQQQQQARPSESSRPTVYGAGVGPNPSREHQAASSPRTLRRQTSITQRIAKYIRPPKPVERGVETLVE